MNISKVKIWLSQERKELLNRNKKHFSLFHKYLPLDLQNRLAKMQQTQPSKHSNNEGQSDVLWNISITLIDKTDGKDPK